MVPKARRNDGYPRPEDGDFVQEAALNGFVGADGFPADCYLNTDAVIAAMSQAWVKNG
jgi:hypothetical protein